MKIKQADGSEIEVFTQAETEEKIKSEREKALNEYKASNPDKSVEVADLSTKLAEATRKLEEAEASGGNPEQIKRLREAREKAENDRDEVVKKFTGEFESFKKETIDELKSDLMQSLAKGDKELEKKIQLEFDNYRANENTKLAIRERMEKAYQLATGNRPTPTAFDAITGAAGFRGAAHDAPQGGNMSDNAKKIGRALGISDKQRTDATAFLKEQKEKQGNTV